MHYGKVSMGGVTFRNSNYVQRSDAANNCELYGGYLAQVCFNQFEVDSVNWSKKVDSVNRSKNASSLFKIDSMEENFCLLEYINTLVFHAPPHKKTLKKKFISSKIWNTTIISQFSNLEIGFWWRGPTWHVAQRKRHPERGWVPPLSSCESQSQ